MDRVKPLESRNRPAGVRLLGLALHSVGGPPWGGACALEAPCRAGVVESAWD